uniref:SFRICE_002511 n=1 Tax=Spodoptera frugiperda TaxID=7108 RepID=A0A2H1VY83_SPOFR
MKRGYSTVPEYVLAVCVHSQKIRVEIDCGVRCCRRAPARGRGCVRRCAWRGRGAGGAERVRGPAGARAADAPRWWAATAARRARRAPGRRGMSSAPARPGPRARHGAGRARAPSHPLLREEDLPQADVLPPLLGPAVGPHRAGLRLRRYASRMRPVRVDTGSARGRRRHDQRVMQPGARAWPRACPPRPGRPPRSIPPRRPAPSARPASRLDYPPTSSRAHVACQPCIALHLKFQGPVARGGARRCIPRSCIPRLSNTMRACPMLCEVNKLSLQHARQFQTKPLDEQRNNNVHYVALTRTISTHVARQSDARETMRVRPPRAAHPLSRDKGCGAARRGTTRRVRMDKLLSRADTALGHLF